MKCKRENWFEDICMVVNQYDFNNMEREKVIEKLFNLTKYNRNQLAIAYRMLFKKGEVKEFFCYEKYVKN